MNVDNITWAKTLARKYYVAYPRIKDDLIGAALLGLAKALKHPLCPHEGTVEFRNRASRFIRDTIIDELRFHYPRYVKKGAKVTIGTLVADIYPRHQGTINCDWADLRAYIASRLTPGQARVFLAVYGEDRYFTFAEAAEALGVTPQCAYQQHQLAHKTVSTLLREVA